MNYWNHLIFIENYSIEFGEHSYEPVFFTYK